MIALGAGSLGGSCCECTIPKNCSVNTEAFWGFNGGGLQRERKDFGVPPNLCYKNSTNLNGLRISTYCGGGNRNPLSSLSRMTYLNGEGQNPTPHGTEDSSNLKEMDVNHHSMRTVGNSTNIVWQECSVGKAERQKLLQQKGCVIWITGLSGSGKSTLACSLSRQLHCRGKLTYILDGDNVRHGLNKDLSFKAEDRAENIRRIGEVAKLFADAGVICIASLISPYRRDRDACRAMLPEGTFIEVFMNMPLEVCEARDSKGLYKLARAGKIKGFTGIDDPYEPPVNCEIVVEQKDGVCSSPTAMAEQVVAYLEDNGFLQA